MGRPPLNMSVTSVRFPPELLERIDALVGTNQRAIFIREAVEARVKYAEGLRQMQAERDKR